MARGSNGEREQFWRALIGRQPRSGLSIRDFCESAGVSANSFFVWKRRLRSRTEQSDRRQPTLRRSTELAEEPSRRKGDSAAAGSLVPVHLIPDPVSRPASNAGAIEVEWPNGVVLRVPRNCDAGTLRDVLHALRTATDAEVP